MAVPMDRAQMAGGQGAPNYSQPSLSRLAVDSRDGSNDAKHSQFTAAADAISISNQSAVSIASANRMADFFGAEVFQMVLHNPTTSHQLLKFSQSRFCVENLEFLDKVDRYNKHLHDLAKTTAEIYHSFISPNAPNQISLSHNIMEKIASDIRTNVKSTLSQMESIFSEAQLHIERLVFTDIYPRFVKHQMTMSAVKALASGRGEYQGLGDCFCLTDPAKADNPIVAASDGFVKVTGYPRSDIIPRNCRFLQGRHTDRASVHRLKAAIEGREESVELLLNYKKNGDPFWNLLYVTPLYNEEDKVVFFLGGQINCSTTIHSNSDVLRVLSQSEDVEDEKDKVKPIKAPNGGKFSFWKSLRDGGKSSIPPTVREVGMEQHLVKQIEKLDINAQMNAFYTAYSKYLVLNYDKLLINFFSAGIVEVLNPENLADRPMVGVEVFRFLGFHATTMSKDFKVKVKAALRAGQAISLDIHLSTRRSMLFRGDEKFITHWTPLKDEYAKVNWVVVTMGSVVGP